jgi:hypothetical protein
VLRRHHASLGENRTQGREGRGTHRWRAPRYGRMPTEFGTVAGKWAGTTRPALGSWDFPGALLLSGRRVTQSLRSADRHGTSLAVSPFELLWRGQKISQTVSAKSSPCRFSRQRLENLNRHCGRRHSARGVTHASNWTPGSRAAQASKVKKRLRPRCAARAVSSRSAKSASGCCAQT